MSADVRKDERQHGEGDVVKHQDSAVHAQKGYETLDAQAGATYRAGLYILGMMFLVAALAVPLYWLFARQETRSQPPAATLIRNAPVEQGAFPRLVSSEPAVLGAFRAQEDAILNGYAWVEKDRGIARMPIAEAMRIVGERGQLPSFAAEAAAAGSAGGTPPPTHATSRSTGGVR